MLKNKFILTTYFYFRRERCDRIEPRHILKTILTLIIQTIWILQDPPTLAGQSIYQQTLERMNDSSIFERKGRASQTLTDLLLMIMGSIRTMPLPLMLLFHELEDWDGRDLV
jgi:hypothetical protein